MEVISAVVQPFHKVHLLESTGHSLSSLRYTCVKADLVHDLAQVISLTPKSQVLGQNRRIEVNIVEMISFKENSGNLCALEDF